MNKSDIICADVSYFEDRETFVKINDYEKLANENILIVQSLSNNVNDSVIELLFVLDIVKNNNPKSINVLSTYMGYSRQDRIEDLNESFSAKIIAKLLSLSYISKIFTVDIHSQQTLGFFDVPIINISTSDFVANIIENNYSNKNVVLISPDIGNIKNIVKLSNKMNFNYNIAIKYRPKANENKILSLFGDCVKGKDYIILDDIIDSAGTLCNVVEKLLEQKPNNIYTYITHGVLSKKSLDRINNLCIKKNVN